jgi:hypothetical protein
MAMGIFMKENGLMIKLMGTGFTFIQMVLSMKETGAKTNKRALEKRHGQMVLVIKVTIRMAANQEEGSSFGLTVRNMMVNSLIIISMEKVSFPFNRRCIYLER